MLYIFRLLVLLITGFVLYSCKQAERKVVIDKETVAVGRISSDTIYEGVIKFYSNEKKSLLISSATYKKNVLDGELIEYFSNGKVASKLFYKDGEIDGNVLFYDATGNLFSTQRYYFGLRSGPTLILDSTKPKEYSFFSLENQLLFLIEYDSLHNKRLDEIENEFIFIRKGQLFKPVVKTDFIDQRDFLLYIVRPPRFLFDYSLVMVDSNYKILSKKIEFKEDNSFIKKFTVSNNNKIGSYAIRLFIRDSIRNEEYTMFKRL